MLSTFSRDCCVSIYLHCLWVPTFRHPNTPKVHLSGFAEGVDGQARSCVNCYDHVGNLKPRGTLWNPVGT